MAVDLRLLGADFPIGMLGAVGDDEHAAFLLAECARLGIDTAGVDRVPGVATSFTDAMVERDGGRRTFFHHYGANALFDPSVADLAGVGAGSCTPARPVCTRCWTRPARTAATAGRSCCGGPGPPGCTPTWNWSACPRSGWPRSPLPCLPHLDSIVINELEAGALTGIARAGARAPDGPVDWPAAGGDGAAAARAGRLDAGRGALPGRRAWPPRRTGGPGGRARSGCPATQVRSTVGAG